MVTCAVGFLHECLVFLGHQGGLAALWLAEQDGGGGHPSVPGGRILRHIYVRLVLRGFRDVGGDSEMEKGLLGVCAWVPLCMFMDAGAVDAESHLGLDQAWQQFSMHPPFCLID